ncbi:MAG: hydrogenase [Acidobacteria bacterium]|nr:MAG: hydrogenase [Acidobacteriota bacterium]
MQLFSKILRTGIATELLRASDPDAVEIGRALDVRARQLLGRALAIREVDAGSCNGCELEINMEIPLRLTYDATPAPKFVVAVGDCAKSCGVFKGSYAVVGPVESVIPVDVSIAGCPPEPADILRGILAALDRLSPGPAR